MIFIDILIISIGCEVYARLFIPTMNICYDVSPELGVTFCPNQETYGYVEKDYVNIFRTNSRGFHDYEFVKEKDDSKVRIHIYGDSMVQGKGVPIDSTVPKIIERYLNAVKPGNNSYEVMNMASGDDSTSCQIRTYETIGRDYSPDVVICYFSNDFGDNVFEVNGISYSPYHQLEDTGELTYIPPKPKDTMSTWEWFKKTSRLYRLFANKLFESKFYNDLLKFNNNAMAFIRNPFESSSRPQIDLHSQRVKKICTEKSWPLTLKLIEHFKKIVEADGSDFILVDGLKFNDNFVGLTYRNSDFEAFCRNSGIHYIAAYKIHNELKTGVDRKKYFFKDNHPKVIGYKLISEHVAEKMVPFLKSENRRTMKHEDDKEGK